MTYDYLKQLIREVPDFPKPGILFYDITTLLKDKTGLRSVIDALKEQYEESGVDVVVGVEARGFIFAPVLAYALGAGFVPVRKPRKLPAETVSEEEKGRRLQAIIELQQAQSAEINRGLVGSSAEVLVEGPARRREGWLVGKTPQFKTAVFPANGAAPGELTEIRITETTAHTLMGCAA